MPKAPPATVTSISLRLSLPAKELSPNSREPWYVKAPVIAAARQGAKVEALNVKRASGLVEPLAAPVTMDLLFILKDGRRHDLDNLLASFKHHLDGLVDAGLLADDSAKVLRLGSLVARKQEPLEPACVRVTLTGAQPTSAQASGGGE